MKPLALALLALAPLAAGAQDSTRAAASRSWLEQVAAQIAPRPMQARPLAVTLRPVRVTLRVGRKEDVTYTPLLSLPPQVRRSRDEDE